jgi:MFS family permease
VPRLCWTDVPGRLRALTHGVAGATRARIAAWYTSSFTIGASLSFLFGRIGTLLGWRSAFVIAGILGTAAVSIAWTAKEPTEGQVRAAIVPAPSPHHSIYGGTISSNPASSSGESANRRSQHVPSAAACLDDAVSLAYPGGGLYQEIGVGQLYRPNRPAADMRRFIDLCEQFSINCGNGFLYCPLRR